jgi:hypothetical protein
MSVDEMLSSCSFCDFGTAAWSPTFDSVPAGELFRNRAVAWIVPSAFLCIWMVTFRPLLS